MPYRFLRYPEGKMKAVTLSYDDGSCYDLKLLEIINRYGLKCTFNLNSNVLYGEEKLTIGQINSLLADGHEIAVHGAHHMANGIITPTEGIQDVLRCREMLEQTFGRIIRGMAYPDSGILRFSGSNSYETVRNYLKYLGIVYARTLGSDNDRFDLPTDWLAWMPTAHHSNPNLVEYIDKFLSLDINQLYCADQYPRLFYLWGHAHEFHFNNNWNLLENICQKLGHCEDIWYATNMEIYDYVTAYSSLVWSADSTQVYNPTLIPIWFIVGNNVYHIDPGQVITTQ